MVKHIATSFSLHSLDHDKVLLDNEIHSTRHLLGVNDQTPKKLKLTFTVQGETKESVLHRSRGAFGEDATIIFMKAEGDETMKVPETFAYYSEDKNWVLTFHENDKFDGLVFENNGKNIYHFVAKDGQMRVNGDVNSYFPNLDHERKLTSEANGIDYWDDCHQYQSSGLSSMDLGMLAGNVFYQNFGERGVITEMNSYIALSNTIYERQMDISLVIKDTRVATQPDLTNFLPGRCSLNIQTQLQRMASWNPPTRQVLWHLLEDCFGSSGGTLGIAYLGTLCSSYNVGVSYYSDDVYDSDEYPTWATVAHELGHNFDAQHSFEEGQGRTGGIMDYGFLRNKLINGEVQFNSKYREREVCREVQSAVSRGCVDRGAGRPTFEETVAVNREIFATEERKLNCAKHVHKMPATNEHLRRLTGINRVQCKKECAKRENCNGFVFNRESEWCELLEEFVLPESLAYTAEFDTFVCVEGSLDDRFIGKAEDDILDTVNAGRMKSMCCAETEDQAFLGLNLHFKENLTQEECEAECVKNSRCEAVTFDPARNGCMIFGGKDFSHNLGEMQGVSTLTCDRACIAGSVVESSSDSAPVVMVAGGLLLVAGVVAAVVGFVSTKRTVRTNETVSKVTNAANTEEYQATL